MSPSSAETSDISDSDIDDYEAKSYAQLKAEKLKVKISDGRYRCPFCLGKKKQEYQYKDLLQHASGIGASNRKANVKAYHLALVKYLKNDLASTSNSSPQLMMVKQDHPKFEQVDQFVWPWMGIVVNIPTEFRNENYVGESGNRLKEQLSRFNPLKVHALWNFKGFTGNAVVDFSKDWIGFHNAMAFENHFDATHFGKKDLVEKETCDIGIYGWVARSADYNLHGPIGNHLRKTGDLMTVADIIEEQASRPSKVVQELKIQIEINNNYIEEINCKYTETTLSLNKMMEEMDKLHESYNNEIQRMRHLSRDHSRRIIEENKKLTIELESKRNKLASRSKQLDELVAQSNFDRRKFEDEEKKIAIKNSSLELASTELKHVDDEVFELIEAQKYGNAGHTACTR